MNDIRKFIINKSKELNIDIIGFTNSEPLNDIKEYLQYRIDKNINTEFEEADLELRIDPKLTFPDCKSIIVLGLSYNVDYKNDKSNILVGSLSRSSWGLDYHNVLKDKIEELIREIKNEMDFSYKYFVDTGPLVDRELARKAGIGYYGKNCSIINKEYGSFIFLGYILTDLHIESREKEEEDACGDCNLCIKACPTGALNGDYTMNPKICISYLTQTKDVITEELLEKMGNQIYGCDSCQLVCPKNRGVKKSSHIEFIPECTNGIIDIEELFSMSNRQFKEKYGSMAASWRGKNILKRNAIIALGNLGHKENISLLIQEKKKKISMLNPYIDWALSKINRKNDYSI
ncbi:MAG TPA: tRNA epoxyqueuosine(34) reductase QueG [Tissierellaceae bacterium]|nr:tRNA epoxyqueuosine(34) reductase QueG [Tissierellaceae bacterium]